MKPQPIFEVSPWYPEASYPWGKPMHERRIRFVSSLAKRPIGDSKIGLELPLSAWKITVYDDKPRRFNVYHAADFSTKHFTARSLRAALQGIRERCDERGAVKP